MSAAKARREGAQHTPEQVARAFKAAANTLKTATDTKLTDSEALAIVTGYIEASPSPPLPVTFEEKLLAGIVKALR